ncbi:MAG: J domain-containing protein [Leptolyngbyaceae cyanobacterium]
MQPLDNPPPTSHYKVLKLAPWATAQDVRRAYRELSKLYHPDTTTLPEAVATVKFQQLNEAYGTLSSPDKRSRYDIEHGYSRFSGVRPIQNLESPGPQTASPANRDRNRGGTTSLREESRPRVTTAYLDPNDRPLSPGELFAVLLLGLTFTGCILLVVLVGWFRGEIILPADALLN